MSAGGFVVFSIARSIRSRGKSVWKKFGLGIALMVLFFATWIARGVAEWLAVRVLATLRVRIPRCPVRSQGRCRIQRPRPADGWLLPSAPTSARCREPRAPNARSGAALGALNGRYALCARLPLAVLARRSVMWSLPPKQPQRSAVRSIGGRPNERRRRPRVRCAWR